MSEEKHKVKALKKIASVCKGLELELFSEQEFYDYINILNKEANKEFKIEDFGNDYFTDRFGIK